MSRLVRVQGILLLLAVCGCSIEYSASGSSQIEPGETGSTTHVSSADGGVQTPAEATPAGPQVQAGPQDLPAEDQDNNAHASDTAARADGETLEISFEDIELPIQEDMVFRPFMLSDRAKQLDGKRIRISGYMLPDSRTKGIKQFVLLKNTECKFGPGGKADHLLNVLMVAGSDASFRDDPVSVEGTLTVNPFTGPDGNTWSIYDLACDQVKKYRPRR